MKNKGVKNMAQKMFLDAQYKQLVKNFKEQDGTKEFKAVVKLFNPAGVGTWYLSELNPDTNEAFGLADVHEKELGYVSINELKAFKAPFGLGIERDTSFEMNKQSLQDLNQ
jgi:hypothetical protein